MLKVGSKNIANVQVGSKKVKQIYAGSKLVWEAVSLPANFADATPAQIKYAFDNKKVPSTWAVGDEHTITLTNGNTYTLQLLDMTEGRYSKTDGSGKTNCVIGFKTTGYTSTNRLATKMYSSSSSDTYNHWYSSELRNPYLIDLYALFPDEWKNVIPQCYVYTYANSKDNNLYKGTERLFIPAVAEVTNPPTQTVGQATTTPETIDYSAEGTVFEYYKDAGDYDNESSKRMGDYSYWLRTPYRWITSGTDSGSETSRTNSVSTNGNLISYSVTKYNNVYPVFAI